PQDMITRLPARHRNVSTASGHPVNVPTGWSDVVYAPTHFGMPLSDALSLGGDVVRGFGQPHRDVRPPHRGFRRVRERPRGLTCGADGHMLARLWNDDRNAKHDRRHRTHTLGLRGTPDEEHPANGDAVLAYRVEPGGESAQHPLDSGPGEVRSEEHTSEL